MGSDVAEHFQDFIPSSPGEWVDRELNAIDKLTAPIDQFSESIVRGLTFQPQGTSQERAESFQERPWWQQVPIGLATDPSVGIGALGRGARAGSQAVRQAPATAADIAGRLGGLPGETTVRAGGQTVRATPQQKAAEAFQKVSQTPPGQTILKGDTPIEKMETGAVDLAQPLQERIGELSMQIAEIDEGIVALRNSGIHRPRWAVGMSNAELEALAKHEGKNPYSPDWFDAIDSDVIRMGKTGYFRQPGADTITSLQRRRRTALHELREDNRQLKEVQAAQQIQARVQAGGQAPARPPGAPLGSGMGTPDPARPDIGLSDDLNIPSHEKPQTALMRRWEGARNLVSLEMEQQVRDGQRLMAQAGVQRADKDTMMPLLRALDGEISADILPPNLKGIHDDLKSLVEIEDAEMRNFLLTVQGSEESQALRNFDADNLLERFTANEDYFPRMWKGERPGVASVARGRLGATPGFMRERTGGRFSDMIAAGKEPISWDPYSLMALRRISGIEFRETTKLVNQLYKQGLAKRKSELTDAEKNWKVPRVGPVFEGRPIPDPNGTVTSTEAVAVPRDVAGFLETSFGHTPEMNVGNRNIIPVIRQWSNSAKRLKLVGSLFQHVDFATRSLGAAFTPTGISKGAPLQYPSLLYRLQKVSWSPGAREQLANDLTSNKPLYTDFPISYRQLVQEGWGVQGDTSLIRREMVNFVDETARASGLGGQALEKARKTMEFFESGLFDGVYREAQRDALVKFVIPALRRRHPDWNPQQIAAQSATEINTMFSTLGRWQNWVKDPAAREFAQTMLFSTNEQESMIRQGLNAIKGPEAGLWREYWLGLFLGIGTVANLINFSATGRPLPAEAYNPISLDDPYSLMGKLTDKKINIGYNGGFLSPQIPGMTGRNGTPMYIDLVGQADTVFRWALSPFDALSARFNVFPRAIWNQAKGSSFMGDPLDTIGKRLTQAAVDVGAPIGATQALGAARDVVPGLGQVFPPQEDRLGAAGQLIQGTGLNLRSETNPDLLDRVAQQRFGVPYRGLPPSQGGLQPFEQDIVDEMPGVDVELDIRNQVMAGRGNENAEYRLAVGGKRKQTIALFEELGQEARGVISGTSRTGGIGYMPGLGQVGGGASGTSTRALDPRLASVPTRFRRGLADYYGIPYSTSGGGRSPKQELVDEYFQGKAEFDNFRAGAAAVTFDDEGKPVPPALDDPLEQALAEYHFAAATSEDKETGRFNSDSYARKVEMLDRTWTLEQRLYVRANSNLLPVPPDLLRILPEKTRERIRLSEAARAAQLRKRRQRR